jgi:hypothetical protein
MLSKTRINVFLEESITYLKEKTEPKVNQVPSKLSLMFWFFALVCDEKTMRIIFEMVGSVLKILSNRTVPKKLGAPVSAMDFLFQ